MSVCVNACLCIDYMPCVSVCVCVCVSVTIATFCLHFVRDGGIDFSYPLTICVCVCVCLKSYPLTFGNSHLLDALTQTYFDAVIRIEKQSFNQFISYH